MPIKILSLLPSLLKYWLTSTSIPLHANPDNKHFGCVQGWVFEIFMDHHHQLTEMGQHHHHHLQQSIAKADLSLTTQEGHSAIMECVLNTSITACFPSASTICKTRLQWVVCLTEKLISCGLTKSRTYTLSGKRWWQWKLLLTPSIQATSSLSNCHHSGATRQLELHNTKFLSRSFVVAALYVLMYYLMMHTGTKPKPFLIS